MICADEDDEDVEGTRVSGVLVFESDATLIDAMEWTEESMSASLVMDRKTEEYAAEVKEYAAKRRSTRMFRAVDSIISEHHRAVRSIDDEHRRAVASITDEYRRADAALVEHRRAVGSINDKAVKDAAVLAEDLHEACREARARGEAENAYLARGEAEKAAIKARDEEGAKRPFWRAARQDLFPGCK